MKDSLLVLHAAETVKGGVATYINLLSRKVSIDGVSFAYHIPHSQKSYIEANLNEVNTHNVNARTIFGFLRYLYSCTQVVLRLKPKVVYAHSTFSGIAFSILKSLGFKFYLIYCPHGWAVFRPMGVIKKKLVCITERLISKLPDVVVDISKFEHVETLKLGYKGNKLLIPNSIDIQTSTKSIENNFLTSEGVVKLLFVGRFDKQKGLDILISALEVINKYEIKFELYVVGDYVLSEQGDLNLEKEWVTNLGWQKPECLDSIYSNCDMLVVPSRWEGFGLVVLEAYKNSLPVLVSDKGGLPELVEDNVSGYIFDGSVPSLTLILEKVLSSDLKYMGAKARDRLLSEYNIVDFIAKQEKIILGGLRVN